MSRIVEIKTQGAPSAYVFHDEFKDESQKRVQFYPRYDDIKENIEWIRKLYVNSKTVLQNFDPEEEALKLLSQNKKFNMANIESISEQPLFHSDNILARRIMPLVQIHGNMFLTNRIIYFQPFHSEQSKPVKKIDIDDIQRIYRRRFELRNIGLEIIIVSKQKERSFYFAFDNETMRNQIYDALIQRVGPDCISELSLEKITTQWQNREISNYDYLIALNHAGNRSFSDLSQYPVFPWVLQNFTSENLDLNDNSSYRDLKKPVGALNPKRLDEFKKRYNDMPDPKFLYGTHYSTPGYVIGYLVRKHPQYMLKLQSGRFDQPDRLFKSIKGDWENVMTNPASVKEPIPEFYMEDDSFLINKLKLNLGVRQNQKIVQDVKLPYWAKNAKHFLQINRQALESEYVSNELHNWIDLIFGYKQRGPQSIEADNVFHYLTYEGTKDLEKITDIVEKQALRCQINEFGQCPKQIFKIPHPSRNALKQQNSLYSPLKQQQINQIQQEEKNDFKSNQQIEEQKLSDQQEEKFFQDQPESKNGQKVSMLWDMDFQGQVSQQHLPRAHKGPIKNFYFFKKNPLMVLSIGQDGFLKVIDFKENVVVKSFKISDFCLSCVQALKDDEIFAIGSWDNKVYIFNLNYGSKLDIINSHNDSVSAIVYIKQKNIMLTASWDCTIKSFKTKEGSVLKNTEDSFIDHESQITYLTVSNDNEMVAFGDVDGKIIVASLSTREMLYQFELTNSKIIKLMFYEKVLIAAGENLIKLMQCEIRGNDISKFQIEQQNGLVSDVQLDKKFLVICTSKGHVGVYDLLQEKKVGAYFNDFKNGSAKQVQDNGDTQFTALSIREDSTVCVIGTQQGSIQSLLLEN